MSDGNLITHHTSPITPEPIIIIMKKLFGTDGLRGKANIYPMTPEVAMALGQAVATYFKNAKTARRIVIGKDTRRSSYMVELAIAAGVCSMGSNAVLLGPIATPGVAFITKAMRADAGVMISASHNPFDDNGIKFFDSEGFKLGDEVELELEAMVEKGFSQNNRPTGRQIGKAYRVDDALGRYIEFVKKSFPKAYTLEGLKIVVDSANGAAYKLAPLALWELGAEVVSTGDKPDGYNINENCGALHPGRMAALVTENAAHVGIALDGDADRVVLCDERGEIVDGDQVIALCALEMAEQGALTGNRIVGTSLSNKGVENFLADKGISMIRTHVGDRYIIEKMRALDIKLGGEPSGHVIFARHTTTGDGLIAALQVLAAMVRSGRKLSELVARIPVYPQVNQNLRVKEKKPLTGVPEIHRAIEDLEKRLDRKGRVVVRYSGTEPVLRLMIEGENRQVIQKELETLTRVARRCLG